METRKLGKTDIKVSKICLGTMTFGEQNTEAEAFEQLDYATAHGVNFIDCAEMYPVPPKPETYGRTEEIVGNWLQKKGRRDELVLATKVTGRSAANSGVGHIRGGPRLSREQILQACDASLARLKTEYIDLYQVHWPERQSNFFGKLGYQHSDDDGIDISETLSALQELVDAGKVRHIGLSNETPWGMHRYLRLAAHGNKPRVASIQNPYSLLNRTFEVGLAEMAIREQCGLLAYSPLAFGTLSGKYLGGARPAAARLTLFERFQRYTGERAVSATEQYLSLARDFGLDPAQMALAFVSQQPFVTANIIGATTMEQLKSNIGSSALLLSPEQLEAIESVHQQNPSPAP
ncbi:NADP(H)-dependent aldo-keto reductase [Microbulbifer hydrolyticus]|uniref:Protein tas n=1 Tax=Microbulbifer hydrolyticus TaxID=48074 RepID=A0A6P1TDM5_9GAMM|nr:NADP(H)-dependent aldo-keto reductase [Microbulbifer hydrolyticus]MBB5212259.1 aryl-alcohol dehydrogenase-like predicted oxidoreductase [Microbulbifer hydrolyticus]QHQ39911.1 NADP(H)-dependent aldo-keto reductase [Microbulbifer hydrolyticus]